MNRFVKQWANCLAIGAALLVGATTQASGVAAQNATPVSGAFIPDIADCQASPRTVEELVALFATATPVAWPSALTSVEVPVGTPTDAVISDAVKGTINELFACLNGGDFLRFFSLLTDEALLTNFYWVGESIASGDMPAEFTTPMPLPPDLQQTILAIGDVASFDDGRAGAVVLFIDPVAEDSEVEVLYLIFTLQNDRWVIDQAIEL